MEVLGLLLRVACVFALLFGVLALLKRTEGFRAARRRSPVQVLGSTRLGKGAALAVVRIGDAEHVLGVTDHAVTLLTTTDGAEHAPEHAPDRSAGQTAPAALPAGPDFAAALAGAAPVPPTAAEFLRSAYRVARGRAAESTDLSADAVRAALASVCSPDAGDARGDTLDLTPRPSAADGPAAPVVEHALLRVPARTDAQRSEEHPWTRSGRPTSRSTHPDAVLG